MSENLFIVSSVEQARDRFQLKFGEQSVPIKSPCLVSEADLAWVVTSQEPGTLQSRRFGFTSHRSDKRLDKLNIPPDTLQQEGLRSTNGFNISESAEKKQARSIKSIIKLDKNLPILREWFQRID